MDKHLPSRRDVLRTAIGGIMLSTAAAPTSTPTPVIEVTPPPEQAHAEAPAAIFVLGGGKTSLSERFCEKYPHGNCAGMQQDCDPSGMFGWMLAKAKEWRRDKPVRVAVFTNASKGYCAEEAEDYPPMLRSLGNAMGIPVEATGIAAVLPEDEARRAALVAELQEKKQLGAEGMHAPHFKSDAQAADAVRNADIVFFAGGDQAWLVEQLKDTDTLKAVNQRIKGGNCIISGTSAGTAAMAQTMVDTDAHGMFAPKPGFGFLPFPCDTHFGARRREQRLQAMLADPNIGSVGVGVDEQTALILEQEGGMLMGKVIGAGGVTLMNGTRQTVLSKDSSAFAVKRAPQAVQAISSLAR